MNKYLLGTLTAASLTAGAAAYAEAEYTLVFSSWVPPTHNINAQMLPNIIGNDIRRLKPVADEQVRLCD